MAEAVSVTVPPVQTVAVDGVMIAEALLTVTVAGAEVLEQPAEE